MSIFGKIAAAIFGGAANAAPAAPAATPAAGTAPASSVTGAAPSPAASPGSAAPAPAAAGAAKMSSVDVAEVLDGIDADEDLDWRKSIVDLMKLLKLDSSLKARKELADELKFTGDKSDSASMNIWLHKQVMTKLAENGGVVPKDLKH
jgi:hypothetical protein